LVKLGASELCPICDRPLGDVNVDRHHLIPKSRKGKEQYLVHMICHRKLHATFTEKELEKKYHTWEELRAHPDITSFVAWVQKKSPEYYDCTVTSNQKRGKRR
jgi:hypothetical protein